MSIGFDLTPVRPKRSRVDAPIVVAIAVVLGLGTAVVKPWDATGDPEPPSRPVAEVASPTASPTAPAVMRPPAWSDFASVVGSHDSWGVKTISRRKTPPWSSDKAIYVEDWAPTTTEGDGTWISIVEPADGPIVLLGVTVPTGVRPDAVLIWRILDDGWERIDADPIQPSDRSGSLLFIRPASSDAPYEAWDAGRYRIEIVDFATILRIVVEVPGRT